MTAKVSIVVIIATLAILSSCSFGSGALPPGHAIVYGVSDYAPLSPPLSPDDYDLNFGDDDAIEMAAMLTSQGYTVTLRTDDQATAFNLQSDLDSAATADPDTRFVFYYAGHGLGDSMADGSIGVPGSGWDAYYDTTSSSEPVGSGAVTEYLVLYEAFTDLGDPTLSVSDDELAAWIAAIPSRQKVVIIDACHSGGFVGDGTATDSVPMSYDGENEGVSFFDALDAVTLFLTYGSLGSADVSESDAVVIAAAGEREFSYEYRDDVPDLPDHGLFTYYFLQAPQLADRDYDGFVTVSEAYGHARDGIMSIENEFLFGDGKFVPRVTGGAIDFVLFETP